MTRILLVDDDVSLNDSINKYLTGCDYEVVSVYDADSAFVEIANRDFDAIISDIMMPNIDGEPLSLSAREFDLLFKLLSFPKRTFSRSQLMEEFWGYDSSGSSRAIDVFIAELRKKISGCDGFDVITVHGLGYKVVPK